MVADDDPEFRDLMNDIINNIFDDEEIQIVKAENGKNAIELFDKHLDEEEPIDIVVTDFVMPEASGSDVIDHIMKKHPVPIVVVSAFPEALSHDFIQEGAIYFLRKPFNVSAAKGALNAATALKIIPKDLEKAKEAIDRLRKLNI